MDKTSNIDLAVHFGKENDEDCHIKITGTLDIEFFDELQELMLKHEYIDSL